MGALTLYGQQVATCSACGGGRMEVCPECRGFRCGSGLPTFYPGERNTVTNGCKTCGGQGQVRCTRCGGLGVMLRPMESEDGV
jgi:hypothetical protein